MTDEDIDELIGSPQSEAKPDDSVPVVTSAIDYPTVFADGVWFAANLGGAVRITFLETIFEPRNSPAPGMKSRHVGTLVMPRQSFENMVDYLTEMRKIFRDLDGEDTRDAE
jgi:hypothetical protein